MKNEIASRILYCDSHCIVVNKIAGEAVESAGKGMVDLPRLLAAELAGTRWLPPADNSLALPTAVHRLDVPVSGCAVFARTRQALVKLNESFAKNTVEKMYWAIVEIPNDDKACQWLESAALQSIELVHWIEFNPRKNKSIAHNEPGPGRKKAILRCRLVGRGRDYLFLEIELVTGRHHQIRAQLQRLGLHIKGDLKYGSRRSEKGGGIRLHARSIAFPEPADGLHTITVKAAPPLRDCMRKAKGPETNALPKQQLVHQDEVVDNLWLAFEEQLQDNFPL